ncbi:MAG: S8 family serine peptidase [Actinomycetota bacterium]
MTSRTGLRLVTTAVALSLLGFLVPDANASTDLYSGSLWGIRTVRAEAAWNAATGRGVTIAIVDSGVDATHEDLRANVVPGYDLVDNDADASDEAGHGTHVAGIAAAVANNGLGVAGVAPNAKIMPVRVLDADGVGSLSRIEEGVRWAVDHGADVVNLSLSADFITEFLTGGTLTDAVNFAWSRGVIPVISAGNESLFRSELRRAKAIVVTATTPDDRKASYATGVGFAPWGIAAPGGTSDGGQENMIFSTWWASDEKAYAYAMGTSMATPHVAGAAALLRSMGLSPKQTVDRLLNTAKDLGSRGNDSTYGHGRLDVAAAAQAGAQGPAGRDGSSAEGASATGRPGSSAGGSRGASGERAVRRSVTTSTPTTEPGPSAPAPPIPSPEAGIEDDGIGSLPFILAGAGAVVAAGAAFLYLRLKRR